MAFSYYRPVVIDHTKVGSSDLTDFPVAVFGTFGYLATVANGGKVQSASGYDIQFFSDSALTTALTFERESWDGSSGAAAFWVKISSLSHTSDTTIYIAYGDAGVTTDQSDKTNVWDSNYQGVYHCVNANDSTSNARHGSATGTSTDSHIGGALAFASGDQIDLPDTFGNPANLTIEAWASCTGVGTLNEAALLWIANSQAITLGSPSGFGANTYEAGSRRIHVGSSPLGTGWHHYVFTCAAGSQVLYKDGVSIGTGSVPGTPPYTLSPTSTIGRKTTSSGFDFAGSMDEIRVSSTIRSADWVLAGYNNISDSSFYTIGSEISGSTAYTATLSDTYSLTESLSRLVASSKSETISIASTLTRRPGKAVTDQFVLSETFSKLSAKILALLDSLVVTDLVSRSSFKAYAEVLSISDSLARATSKAWQDTITLAEAIGKKTSKSVTNACSLVESLVKSTSKSFISSLSITEAFTTLRVKMLALVDDLNFSDSITRSTGKAFQSTITIVENLQKAIGRSFSEMLSLLDLLATARVKMVSLVDSLVPVDSLKKSITKGFATSLSIVDRTTKAISRSFLETFSISEFFRGGKIYFVSLLDSISLVDSIATVYHRSVAIIRTFIAELLERLWPAEVPERHYTVAPGAQRNMITDISKPSASIEDFRISWEDAIGTDIITGSEWVSSSPDMVIEASSFSESTAMARIGGGRVGKIYVITNHVTLASQQIKSQALQFRVTD